MSYVCVWGGGGGEGEGKSEVVGILNKIYPCIKLMTSPPCMSMYILNVCGGKGLGY